MKVRMLKSMCGPGVRWPAGSEQDIDSAEAQRIISAGYAEPVRSKKVERATAPSGEKAVTRRRAKK